MDQTARQYVQRSAWVTSSPRRRASSRTLGGRSATFTVAIGGAVARQARDRHSDLRCIRVRRSVEHPFARVARVVKLPSVHTARAAGRIRVVQRERADLDRALARRPDWARRVAVLIVALAAAAATFFFFSPMARCESTPARERAATLAERGASDGRWLTKLRE